MTTPRYYDADPFHNTEERATGWEEGHHYAYEVKNIGPIKSAYNRFSLTPLGEVGEETLLTQTLDFQMKFGPAGALMDTLVFRPQFRKQMEQSLEALKEYVEYNEAVESSVNLALTA
jgi:SRSO17 transposase